MTEDWRRHAVHTERTERQAKREKLRRPLLNGRFHH